ncbi:MAG: alpha/beta hydrolase [Candidatus Dormibacteria bacterium]
MAPARPSILFAHGMYMNAKSWDPWVARAQAAGFETVVPSWPYHVGEPAELRRHIDPKLGRLTFGQVVQHFADVIGTLPDPPLVIGHSVGGLVVQRLVNDGLVRAGVAVSSAPALGVISLDPHFLRANFPHVNPLAGNRPVAMTPARFHYTFCNTMSRAASDRAFEEYVVPESRNVPRSTLLRSGRIHFRREHAPLLMIAGDTDHLCPLPAVRRNARRYRRSAGLTRFQAFPGRSHFICNQEGWEEVADASFDFLRAALA